MIFILYKKENNRRTEKEKCDKLEYEVRLLLFFYLNSKLI
jgi:hypothetical protein